MNQKTLLSKPLQKLWDEMPLTARQNFMARYRQHVKLCQQISVPPSTLAAYQTDYLNDPRRDEHTGYKPREGEGRHYPVYDSPTSPAW